ncbi:MAG TPA: 4Fe-4S ferredoxin [candidate division Zixibacteria bacterium]|nr:4Fe-4S ferredoxin [candidate division Zixibacteria bacterium]
MSGIKSTGVPSRELIESTFPSEERRKSGPFAVIECWQEIPCDPCVASCPFHSIADMQNINDLPVIDHSTCNGCGVCIAQCPGLAIFVIDETFGAEDEASIRIPHEFTPLPAVGDTVRALNRDGSFACEAKVIKVRNTKSKTPVIEIAIPARLILDVRAIEPLSRAKNI